MSTPLLPLPLVGMHFKGERCYLQGPDILSAALLALCANRPCDAVRDIDITFHALAHTGLTLQADVSPGQTPSAQLKCTMDGVARKLYLVEDGRPILKREPYAEQQIVTVTDIDTVAKTAASSTPLPFTNIERWVAMTKALHLATYPQAKGKWLFARARLKSYQGQYDATLEHRITIASNLGGKLTRNTLRVGDSDMGDIFFVLT